jgi:GntR family transcriptional regulator/MocR family aminotransferase
MAKEQTTSTGPEVLLAIDREAGGVREQVETRLRESIRAGTLAAGTRLPSSRALAADLGVARATITEVYEQLLAEGYLVARQGSGTRVAERATAGAGGDVTRRDGPLRAEPLRGHAPRFDLRPGGPDLQLFPRAAMQRAFKAALAELPDAELDYGDPRGLPRLRVALAAYLGRVRGVVAAPDDIVVTSGFGNALSLFLDGAAAPADGTIAIEDPGQPAVRDFLLAGRPVDVMPVKVDAQGLWVVWLAPTGASTVLVTPAHQYPTGVVMTAERRAELVEWARAQPGRLVIEDDYDSEFRYDREPIGAIQGLAPDVVVHCGSVSKTLAPAMRMGWAVAPPHVAAALADRRAMTDHGAPPLLQAALGILLETGEYDRHLRRMRAIYRRRRDALLAALATELPQATVSGAAAGLHLVLTLPDGTDEAAVIARAAERGVGVHGMAQSYVRHSGPPALVIGYGRIADGALRRAVGELAAAVRAD